MRPDDPMMPLLGSFARVIRFLAARTTRSDRVATEASQRITAAIQQARELADAETARFRAGLEATEADLVHRIGTTIARSADDALRRRIRVFDRNTALLAAAVFVFSLLGAYALGDWRGSSRAYADIHETEAGLQAAFTGGPDAARSWLHLMTWNDIRYSLRLCTSPGQTNLQHGRKACNVPLWIEPPHPTSPNAP